MGKLASIQTVNAVEPIPTRTPSKRSASSAGGSSSRRANTSRATSSFTARSTRFYRRAEFEFLRASSFKPARTDATGGNAAGWL